ELELHVVPSSAWVRSDAKLLRRVVQSFLSNAIRSTASGKILMCCRRMKGFLRIEVWDTGPGRSEEQLGRMVEGFGRCQHGRDKKGRGLGLAIVDRISGMLDPPVAVHRPQGEGSTFAVTVRRAPAEQVHASRSKAGSSS